MGAKWVRGLQVASPSGALVRSLDDKIWEYGSHRLPERTRTVMALIAIDRHADPVVLWRAVAWVWTERPREHRTSTLQDLVQERMASCDPIVSPPSRHTDEEEHRPRTEESIIEMEVVGACCSEMTSTGGVIWAAEWP